MMKSGSTTGRSASATGNGRVGNSAPTTFDSVTAADTLTLGSYSASASGSAQYLHFRVQYIDAAAVKRFGVWSSSGTLLAEFASAAYAIDTGTLNWYVITLASPLTLTSGQTYILGLCTSDASYRVYQSSGTPTKRTGYPPGTAFGSIDPAGISGVAAFVLDNDSNATPT